MTDVIRRVTGFSPGEVYAKAKGLEAQGFRYSPGSIGWVPLKSGRVLFSGDCIRPVLRPVRLVKDQDQGRTRIAA